MAQSDKLFERALAHIPGGVNSPVRSFSAVGGNPLVIQHAKGSHIFDADGKKYIDYVGSWGTAILGHAVAEINKAVKQATDNGLSFGTLTKVEVLMAERICELVDAIDMVRMVNSGTEATMSAIRLARGFTNRDLIVKFDGCYHGHSDTLLSGAGSGVLTLGIASSPGVPQTIASQTIVLEYNNPQQVRDTFKKFGEKIAAIIVEPIAGNMNLIRANHEFIISLRESCDKNGALLIFDEVMSGFRATLSGAQSIYGVAPDLTTLGKVIGGGLPVGAFGGRSEIMQQLAPAGPIYQAGTLSGNPIAMTAGLETLKILTSPGVFDSIAQKNDILMSGLRKKANTAKVPLFCHHIGGMFGLFFTPDKEVNQFEQVKQTNCEHFKQFFHSMLKQGIYFAPSQYEAGFMSASHSKEDINTTIKAAEQAFEQI